MIYVYPPATSVSASYFPLSLVPPLVFLVLAVYGYRVSVAGQPLFSDEHANGGSFLGRPSRLRSRVGLPGRPITRKSVLPG